MPDLEVETQEITEGGQNEYIHTLPVRVKVGRATLHKGLTTDMSLLLWYYEVLEGKTNDMMRQVTVTLQNVERTPIFSWTFFNAFPVKWTGPKLEASSNSMALESLEIVHHGFQIEAVK
jgi:phage tail-like protein